MEQLLSLITLAEDILRQKGRCVLAMDGMAAAGKTTAAQYLAARWNAPVVHMDDFFLPMALRTEKRLSQPGGNVHYERFAAEVLPELASGRPFSYRRFDCSVMDYGAARTIPAASIVLVEGAYAMHPVFGKYWNVSAFFTIDPETQRRRIIARGGEEVWPIFRSRWIPMENAYHSAFDTQSRVDIVI